MWDREQSSSLKNCSQYQGGREPHAARSRSLGNLKEKSEQIEEDRVCAEREKTEDGQRRGGKDSCQFEEKCEKIENNHGGGKGYRRSKMGARKRECNIQCPRLRGNQAPEEGRG